MLFNHLIATRNKLNTRGIDVFHVPIVGHPSTTVELDVITVELLKHHDSCQISQLIRRELVAVEPNKLVPLICDVKIPYLHLSVGISLMFGVNLAGGCWPVVALVVLSECLGFQLDERAVVRLTVL